MQGNVSRIMHLIMTVYFSTVYKEYPYIHFTPIKEKRDETIKDKLKGFGILKLKSYVNATDENGRVIYRRESLRKMDVCRSDVWMNASMPVQHWVR